MKYVAIASGRPTHTQVAQGLNTATATTGASEITTADVNAIIGNAAAHCWPSGVQTSPRQPSLATAATSSHALAAYRCDTSEDGCRDEIQPNLEPSMLFRLDHAVSILRPF
ncbi:hypothetical protein [Mycobacteroides salmoniphilum]|uniref:hypothetical protein n=1 Tax=Mycobacteroides salmoniphilum TaxID=404941 RepID=UPI00142F8CC0|nr:hypothetical protein [Mycobacteroides salmoniphilum]